MYRLILLTVFISLPVWVVLITRALQTLRLLQVKNFNIRRALKNILLDKSEYQKQIFTQSKLILFLCGALFLTDPGLNILLLFIPLSFVLFLLEAEQVWLRMIRKQIHIPEINRHLRSGVILLAAIIIIAFPYLLLILWLSSFNIPEQSIVAQLADFKPLESATGVSFTDILVTKTQELEIIPLATIVLACATMINIFWSVSVFLLINFLALITQPLVFLKNKRLEWQARNKLHKLSKSLITIGIAGDYGKSTTKSFLRQILQNKYAVATVPDQAADKTGIALTIINEVNENTEVLIAEMNTNQLGEIKEAVNLLPLNFAIITGINEQKREAFDTLAVKIKAEKEIVTGLKKKGALILNGDDPSCLLITERFDHQKYYYQMVSSKNLNLKTKKQLAQALDIQIKRGKLYFTLNYENETYLVKSNLKYEYNCPNLLAAMLAAILVGVEVTEVVEIVNKIDFELPYFEEYPGIKNTLIIDDSGSTTLAGFKIALNILSEKTTPGRKWLLTNGIGELGSEKQEVYHELAPLIYENVDGVITTDRDLQTVLKSKAKHYNCILAESEGEMQEVAYKNFKRDDIVLLEGEISADLCARLRPQDPKKNA